MRSQQCEHHHKFIRKITTHWTGWIRLHSTKEIVQKHPHPPNLTIDPLFWKTKTKKPLKIPHYKNDNKFMISIYSFNAHLQVTEHRHLKYYISVAGPDLLCVSSSKESQEILHRIEREATFSYQTLTLSEEWAANVLYINGTLIHRSVLEAPVSSQVYTLSFAPHILWIQF